ncbi:MAG: hypothetical protein IPJ76_09110 [Flavobacteriales bacterium]|nr:MAG: hypothetical protein IPJ76_09110 [Flavobacteriales bacterium]
MYAQVAERLLVHDTPGASLTYVSTALDGSGNVYSATSYKQPYTYEGVSINMLLPTSSEEVLFCKHGPTGDLLFHKRIAVTGGNTPTVGRIEFMAVDGVGYAYLSTQGTLGSGFLRVEDDSLALTNTGNMVIQLRPDGTLRSVRRYAGIRNVAAADTSLFMAYTDATDGNKLKIEQYDSTFTVPAWSVEGNANLGIGAVSNDRSQLAVSPDGEWIAVLTKEGGGAGQVGLLNVPFQTVGAFDEMAVIILDREGNVQGIRTFFGSSTTAGQNELPNAVAISNDGRVTLSCYMPGTTQFAGTTYEQVAGFSSNYGLIVNWDDQGNEDWAVQFLSQTQSPRIDGLAVTPDGDIVLGAMWATSYQLGSASGSGNAQRSLTARLDGATGNVEWTLIPTSVDNSMTGQRIVAIDNFHFVMSGKALLDFQFGGLPPAGVAFSSQFLLFVTDPSIGIGEIDESTVTYPHYLDPTTDLLRIEVTDDGGPWMLHDAQGRTLLTGRVVRGTNFIELGACVDGIYIMRIGAGTDRKHLRFVKH